MDDIGFGTSVWRSLNDPSSSRQSNFLSSPTLNTSDEFDQTAFDDDDFGETAVVEDTEDFGDFGDFEEESNEIDASSFKNDEGWSQDPISMEWLLSEISSGQSRAKLSQYVDDMLGSLWAHIVPSEVMTNEGIRQLEGLNQVLATPESRTLYRTLFQATPSTSQSTDWIRSRIRRRHLTSLGIPVNLDEVLPHTVGKPLPALHVTMRPSSAPPGPEKSLPGRRRPQSTTRSSRSGTPTPYSSATPSNMHLGIGPKPQLDEQGLNEVLDLTLDDLKLLPVTTLRAHLHKIRSLMETTSSVLTHLLQAKDALQQDAEAYNDLIAELVNEAQKAKTVGKNRTKGNKS